MQSPNHQRVDSIVTDVLCRRRATCIQTIELAASHAMAVRVLDKLQPPKDTTAVDLDAHLAVFIAFKTECVNSPMTHHVLVRLTGLRWRQLQEREIALLRLIDWKLYDGALTSSQSYAQ